MALTVRLPEDLEKRIDAMVDGKGVKNYTLEAVAAADVKGQKVVGSCDAGAKKIVYSRGAAKAEAKVEAKTEVKAEAKHKAEAPAEASKPAAPAPVMKGPVMTKPGAAK